MSHVSLEALMPQIPSPMAAECSEPLLSSLPRELISGPLVHAGEIPVQVLPEPGQANTATSCMCVFRGGTPRNEVVLYHYAPTRSGDVPREVLAGYRGHLQTDAHAAYEGLDGQIRLVVWLVALCTCTATL
jgi:transposase